MTDIVDCYYIDDDFVGISYKNEVFKDDLIAMNDNVVSSKAQANFSSVSAKCDGVNNWYFNNVYGVFNAICVLIVSIVKLIMTVDDGVFDEK